MIETTHKRPIYNWQIKVEHKKIKCGFTVGELIEYLERYPSSMNVLSKYEEDSYEEIIGINTLDVYLIEHTTIAPVVNIYAKDGTLIPSRKNYTTLPSYSTTNRYVKEKIPIKVIALINASDNYPSSDYIYDLVLNNTIPLSIGNLIDELKRFPPTIGILLPRYGELTEVREPFESEVQHSYGGENDPLGIKELIYEEVISDGSNLQNSIITALLFD